MHTNNDYYSFLQSISGGEEIYERVINTEDLYRYGFYENVRNAARMVFECFIDKICEIKKIDYIRKSDSHKSIDYAQTLRYIFNKSSIKDSEWYKNKEIDDYFHQVNIGSHNIGIEDEVSNDIFNDNETLLYIIRDLCIWYYNRIGKTKKNLDGYELPTIIVNRDKVYEYISQINNYRPENNYDVQEIKDSYEQINNSLRTRNIDLNKQLREANTKIEDLIKDNNLFQQKIEKFSQEKTLFEDKIDKTNEIQKDYTTLIRNLKLEEKKKTRLEKENANFINQITIQDSLIKNLEQENKELKNRNKILINKSLLKKETSQKILTIKNDRTRNFYTNVKNAIKHMNDINCYATVVTLYKFFKGINSRQTYYYPEVKEHELWGKYIKEPRFEYRYLEQAINYLLRNDIIILNDDGVYEIIEDKDI